MDKIVTIEDVARAAGVGRGTIDRVLHNRGRVSEETRARVMKCVEELGYRPNIAARILARQGSYRIAVCFHDKEKEFWSQVKAGVNRAAMEYKTAGVSVEQFILPEFSAEGQADVIRRVIDENWDGLALVPYSSPKIIELANEAVEKGISVVAFNNRVEEMNACYVGMNGIQSGRTAGRMMSMIAPKDAHYIVISPHSLSMAQLDEREAGFRQVIGRERADLKDCGRYVIEGYDSICAFAKDQLSHGVNAVYATNECISAVGRAVDECSMTGNVAVVGHDETDTVLHYLKKGCISASIGQEPERQGYLAVEKICKKLLTGEALCDEYTRIGIVVAENSDYQ